MSAAVKFALLILLGIFIVPNANAGTLASKDAERISHLRKTVFGTEAGDTTICTDRETVEADFKKNSLCSTYYRIGKDIVAFLTTNGTKYPYVLEMCPSDQFTEEELLKFPSAEAISVFPSRDSDFFKYYTPSGKHTGFHFPESEIDSN